MRQSFSYTLLITWILIVLSCKTHFVQKSYEIQNISVSEKVNTLDNSIVRMCFLCDKVPGNCMSRIILFSEMEMKAERSESFLTNYPGDLILAEGVEV